MATVSTSRVARKTAVHPIPSKRARKDKIPGEDPIVRQMTKINEATLVTAMTDAGMFHRDALLIELAVGLVEFASISKGDKPDINDKKALRAVYEKAGYACKTPVGEDYKTVARRVGVSADLYVHVGGRETIIDWVEDAPANKVVSRVAEHLREFGFNGINSVLAYMGKPVAVKRSRTEKKEEPPKAPTPQMSETERQVAETLNLQEKERQEAVAKGIPPGRILTRGSMQAVIPFNATYDDVMALAMELMTFAKTQMQLPTDANPTAAPTVQ